MVKMVTGRMACIKYLLFIFNLIFAITGIVLIFVGGAILTTFHDYWNFVDIWLFAAPLLMVIVGVIVFFVSFYGCCGAVNENQCMLNTFSVLLILIFVLELGSGIIGYKMRGEVGIILESRMSETMRDYNHNYDVQNSWNIMQHDLDCCGIDGPADWSKAGFTDNILPIFCCESVPIENTTEKFAGFCKMDTVSIRKTGCVEKLRTFIEDKSLILGGVGVGIALVKFIGIIFSCWLSGSIPRRYVTAV